MDAFRCDKCGKFTVGYPEPKEKVFGRVPYPVFAKTFTSSATLKLHIDEGDHLCSDCCQVMAMAILSLAKGDSDAKAENTTRRPCP